MINRFLNRVSPFRSVRARFSAVMGGSGIVLGLALTFFMQWHLEEGLSNSARDALNAVTDEIFHELKMWICYVINSNNMMWGQR
jgi:hypothetical protein